MYKLAWDFSSSNLLAPVGLMRRRKPIDASSEVKLGLVGSICNRVFEWLDLTWLGIPPALIASKTLNTWTYKRNVHNNVPHISMIIMLFYEGHCIHVFKICLSSWILYGFLWKQDSRCRQVYKPAKDLYILLFYVFLFIPVTDMLVRLLRMKWGQRQNPLRLIDVQIID